MAGLTGLLALDLCIPEQLADALQRRAESGEDLIAVERVGPGYDHAEIGAEVVRRWNFPKAIEQVVRYWREHEHEQIDSGASLMLEREE